MDGGKSISPLYSSPKNTTDVLTLTDGDRKNAIITSWRHSDAGGDTLNRNFRFGSHLASMPPQLALAVELSILLHIVLLALLFAGRIARVTGEDGLVIKASQPSLSEPLRALDPVVLELEEFPYEEFSNPHGIYPIQPADSGIPCNCKLWRRRSNCAWATWHDTSRTFVTRLRARESP